MDDTIKTELEGLIVEGESFTGNFMKGGRSAMIWYSLPNESNYKDWLEACRLWTKNNYKSEFSHIESFLSKIERQGKSPYLHDSFIAKLKAMKKYPEQKETHSAKEEKKGNSPVSINIQNTQNQKQEQEQSQSQSQKMLQEVFLEAIKDELTGKQQKEIKAILEEHKDNIEEAKPKLLNKLAGFGKDVLAGVLVNVITNPNLIGLF